jgi:hypothetical protein
MERAIDAVSGIMTRIGRGTPANGSQYSIVWTIDELVKSVKCSLGVPVLSCWVKAIGRQFAAADWVW